MGSGFGRERSFTLNKTGFSGFKKTTVAGLPHCWPGAATKRPQSKPNKFQQKPTITPVMNIPNSNW